MKNLSLHTKLVVNDDKMSKDQVREFGKLLKHTGGVFEANLKIRLEPDDLIYKDSEGFDVVMLRKKIEFKLQEDGAQGVGGA